jgi:hypothetical protein
MGPLLELGPSNDPVGLGALALGLVLFAYGLARKSACQRLLAQGSGRRWVLACALLAALLSAGYIAYFLRGGPRIIDATSYFLEARALAEGKLAFAVPEPTAAFRGRFSLLGPTGLAVIFPPGYPLALALGFRLGAPLAIGPLLAALLVVTTYVAAKELDFGEPTARLAALLSALCATLRYHTADTMSHGLSGLLLLASFTAALRPTLGRALVAGLFAGWLVATRPMTGAVATVLLVSLIAVRAMARVRVGLVGLAALSLLPGVVLLVAHQRAATGSWLHSTQLAYYALADGPPGCFRWGFGAGVGCRFEHADFVQKHLKNGFGALPALYVTGERLLWHAFDSVNVAPLALLLPWFVWRERRLATVLWAGAPVALVILAYAPFYFPGSYPGGGARLLADVLPFEHLLLAAALLRVGFGALAPGLAVLGFALNTIHAHLSLREREGGHPMFDRQLLAAHRVTRGLLWIDTDHGFALAHDPAAIDPGASLVVARRHGDAHDLALWNELGRPASFWYGYSPTTGVASLKEYEPATTSWRWEAEAEWPPLAVAAGWTRPVFRPCLSGGSGLSLEPVADRKAEVALEFDAPDAATYALRIGWLAKSGARVFVRLGAADFELTHRTDGCEATELSPVTLGRSNRATVSSRDPLVLDYLELTGRISK